MQIDIGIAFFLLGMIAAIARAEIQFPKALYQSLTIFLMIAIGLKGGVALAEHASPTLFWQSVAVVLMGVALPIIAFPILAYIGKLPKIDAASIAAHYGSVSVGTYAVAIAYLDAMGIPYESYIALFVVLLEMPAILVGMALARLVGAQRSDNSATDKTSLLHELFFNQGMVLMGGALIIGYLSVEQVDNVKPLFIDLFAGVLALFLLEMGITAGKQLGSLKKAGSFAIAFGTTMPVLAGIVALTLGYYLGLSTGGLILLTTLGASASYIAVPAAMRVLLPNANHSLSITMSLGITFPFNVIVGIPLYTYLITYYFS